jgi:hypothetical protein
MGCRCKERKAFLQQQWAKMRAERAAGHRVDMRSFLKETALKMPIGQRNLPPATPAAPAAPAATNHNGWITTGGPGS